MRSILPSVTQVQSCVIPGIMVHPQPVTARLALGVFPVHMTDQLTQGMGVGVPP